MNPSQTTSGILQMRVDETLAYAARVVAAAVADPSRWTPDDESDEICRPLDKLLNEAALLALIGHRAVGTTRAFTDLVDTIAACNDALERIYELIRWHPYNWHSLGTVWVVLDRFGRGDPARRAALRQVWQERNQPVPRERSPFRLLDQAWVRSVALGRRDPLLDSADLVACTSFGHPAGAIFMAPADLYAFTHTPMYLTDFGQRGRVGLAPGWAGSLGLWRLLIGDLDLAAELAMTEIMTAAEPDQPTLVILAALATVADALGLLPAPTFRAADHRSDTSPDDYLLFHSYHTTFVFGLLCAALHALRPTDHVIAKVLAPQTSKLPDEWYRPEGGTNLARDIGRTHEIWSMLGAGRGLVLDDRTVLRGTLDAWLLEANSRDDVETISSVLGLRDWAGTSPADAAVRRLMARRAQMKGVPALADALLRDAA